jgi:cystathionine beta-lyase/cystathionine gamma-synthase
MLGATNGVLAIAGVILGLGRSSGIVVCSDEVYHDVHTLLETMKSRYNQNYALVDIMDTGAVLEKVKDVRYRHFFLNSSIAYLSAVFFL